MTEFDNYNPTPSERKVLEVLCNPENAGLNVTELCQKADVSRQTYYALREKPGFIEYKNELIMKMLKDNIGSVIAATVKFASTNSKCSQDRKMLLTMAGMYQDKQQIESRNLNLNADLNTMTDEELEAEYAKLTEK